MNSLTPFIINYTHSSNAGGNDIYFIPNEVKLVELQPFTLLRSHQFLQVQMSFAYGTFCHMHDSPENFVNNILHSSCPVEDFLYLLCPRIHFLPYITIVSPSSVPM